MLMSEDVCPKEKKMFTELIVKSAKRLQDFLEKVMLLASLKSGRREFNIVETNLCDIVHEVISEFTAKALERNIKIEGKFDVEQLVFIDKRGIKKVISMILDNAIRFSPSDDNIQIDVTSDNENVCIRVVDHGEGIEQNYLPHVFDELSDPDVAHHSGGHGLSLAISRQIVLKHKGDISVESTKDSGTVFKVQLPATIPAELVNCE